MLHEAGLERILAQVKVLRRSRAAKNQRLIRQLEECHQSPSCRIVTDTRERLELHLEGDGTARRVAASELPRAILARTVYLAIHGEAGVIVSGSD